MYDTTQLRQSFHSSGVGVAGPNIRVIFFITHGMSMVRAHGNLRNKRIIMTPSILFTEQCTYQSYDVIIAGLPGGEGSWDREGIREAISKFTRLGTEGLRDNLIRFLKDITPDAEAAGVVLAIHPDDPPFSLFGLPRVVSTADDARYITQQVESWSNGLTMCAGSYGARSDNDLVEMVREFGPRIQFVHLRNIQRESDGSFYESEHLSGDNVLLQGAFLMFTHFIEPTLGFLEQWLRVVASRLISLENIDVIGNKIGHLEAECT